MIQFFKSERRRLYRIGKNRSHMLHREHDPHEAAPANEGSATALIQDRQNILSFDIFHKY